MSQRSCPLESAPASRPSVFRDGPGRAWAPVPPPAAALLLFCASIAFAQTSAQKPPMPRPDTPAAAAPAAPQRAPAAATVVRKEPAALPPARSGEDGAIETRADDLQYDRTTGWVEGRGNVTISKGEEVLTADFVRVNVRTEDAYARGNVVLRRRDEVWEGHELRYNFRDRTGDAAGLTGDTGPFEVVAETAERDAENTFTFHNATITTCTNAAHKHYLVTARRVHIVPGQTMKAYGTVWRLGGIPVMYLPYWYRNLREDSGFRFYAGHSSRMGTYLLTSYRYRLSPMVRAETHLDYRSERGLGVGQEFKWRDPRASAWNGDLRLYYLDDDKPIDDDEDAATADIDNQRYRVRFEHEQSFSYRDYILLKAHYLSDTDILEDFFEDEYRDENVPDNYAVYTHRGDYNTFTVQARGRLNDFYESLNRLPEVSYDLMRQPIGDSLFYYQGETAGAYLEKVFPEGRDDEDYSSVRFDTKNTLYRPAKAFGFLNVTPRIGYRGTYYSDTRQTVTFTETTSTVTTNFVADGFGATNPVVTTVTESNSFDREQDAGSDYRNLFEVGLEASFKAFKAWDGPYGERRHVAEPYANYTLVPEPNLTPDKLYRFDSVDTLDEENFILFGMRNKYQKKRTDGTPFDIIDVDVYTRYLIERDEDQDAIDRVYVDAELRPVDWIEIDTDAQYDVTDGELDIFNVRSVLYFEDLWAAELEYRFRNGDPEENEEDDTSSLLRHELTLYASRNWTLGAYGRYEFEDARLEEQGGYLQRNYDCLSLRLGGSVMPGYTRTDGTERDDETRVYVEFWLTAFPDSVISGRHRN
jgi:LPS-assembly protein